MFQNYDLKLKHHLHPQYLLNHLNLKFLSFCLLLKHLLNLKNLKNLMYLMMHLIGLHLPRLLYLKFLLNH
jgi:hypothetical protein